jgi:hypothetical protein
MSESLPKIAIPISISHGRSHVQEIKPVNRLLRRYEQRSVVVRAVMWGVLIGFIGFLLDYSIGRLHWSWLTERILENTFEGALFTLLIWAFLKAREKGLQRRFKQVGYLNHHVRNSLTVIEMAGGYVPEASRRLEMIKSASTRIRRCIEKVSREEDCEINPQAPQEP